MSEMQANTICKYLSYLAHKFHKTQIFLKINQQVQIVINCA